MTSDETRWEDFQTAYDSASAVPALLAELQSGDHDTAMKAAHELWCSLCHQHAFISNASLPACPAIINALASASDELAVEILDILLGFAICSGPDFSDRHGHQEWKNELRTLMRTDLPRFQMLAASGNKEIAEFASLIIQNLAPE